MDRKLFYRVENDNCEGMHSGFGFIKCTKTDDAYKRHPMPEEDTVLWRNIRAWNGGPDSIKGHYRFGFVNLEQLKFWLYKEHWRKELEDQGFHICVYEAEGVYGDTQAVFDIHTAEAKQILKLTEV